MDPVLHSAVMRSAIGMSALRQIASACACTFACAAWGCGTTIIVGDADAGADTGTEPDACEPGSAAGTCSVIDQCGCPEGMRCVWYVDGGTCRLFEACGVTDGDLEVGQECGAGSPILPVLNWPCRPEASCLSSGGASFTCHEWCRGDGDCTQEGSACSLVPFIVYPEPAEDCPGVALSAPYRICSQG